MGVSNLDLEETMVGKAIFIATLAFATLMFWMAQDAVHYGVRSLGQYQTRITAVDTPSADAIR